MKKIKFSWNENPTQKAANVTGKETTKAAKVEEVSRLSIQEQARRWIFDLLSFLFLFWSAWITIKTHVAPKSIKNQLVDFDLFQSRTWTNIKFRQPNHDRRALLQ